jgi:hypothetical protein
MPEPITISICCLVKAITAHSATGLAVHQSAAHAATGLAVYRPAAHAASILSMPIAATTFGGVTFLDVYSEMVKDAYEVIKAQLKRPWLSPHERLAVADSALAETRHILQQKGIFISQVVMWEANRFHSLERSYLIPALCKALARYVLERLKFRGAPWPHQMDSKPCRGVFSCPVRSTGAPTGTCSPSRGGRPPRGPAATTCLYAAPSITGGG